ncbi:unnamed protein product [Rhizoctonia solani]|uniref:Uncharacterized protein n=1 Tax=Rhizoctonia solani TaxID=456999 RepID=A0A8H3CNJ8_9AGAM|nr:unnamed protein product [Rhizoctonia solani]
MSAVALVGACLVSCFVSVTNPWFYTSKCGQKGCPIFHKATSRGRAEVRTRAEDVRQAGVKRGLWRCGEEWEDEGEQMQERQSTEMERTNEKTAERRNRGEPYQGTSPMRMDQGVSVGVDVSHLAPPPEPVDSEVIDRANEGDSRDFGGRDKAEARDERGEETNKARKDKEKVQGDNDRSQWPEFVQVPGGVPKAPPSVLSSGVMTSVNTSRPLLDEAISWERLAGEKESKKRKWWHMP